MSPQKSQIQSVLFAAGRPVKLNELSKIFEITKDELRTLLEELKQEISETGINLIQKDEKAQLVSNPDNAKQVGNFISSELREKLTDAAVETLAVILYKQPVSRAEIESVRGVNSQYILRQLLIRGLIEKSTSTEDARRLVYVTTLDFMTHLGIRDMKELPDFEALTKAVSLPEEPPKPESPKAIESEEDETSSPSQDQEFEVAGARNSEF